MSQWKSTIDAATTEIASCSSTPVTGCTEADLDDFQQVENVELPAAYLRFLRAVGKDGGDFLQGSDRLFGDLPAIKRSALALLEDDAGPPLPQGAFVFCSHQGYQFLFFMLGTDDPAVEYYLEGEGEYRTAAPSFSKWLADTVRDEFQA